MTDRQRRWLEASDKAERQGNDLAAGIFALIAQPNYQERKTEGDSLPSPPQGS